MKATANQRKVTNHVALAKPYSKHGLRVIPLRQEASAFAIDTDSVAVRKRADFWLSQLIEIIGPDLEIELEPNLPLKGTIARRNFGQVQFAHISCSPQTVVMASSKKTQQILVIVKLDGAGSVTQDGRTAHLSLDTLSVCDGDRPLVIRHARHSRDLMLKLPARQLREVFSEWQQVTARTIPCNSGPAAVFADFAKSLAVHGDSIDGESLSEVGDGVLKLLTAMLRALPECQIGVPSHIALYHKDRIRNYVKDQLRDPNLSVKSIAHAVGLSPRYLHRLFSSEDLPLMKWVWTERLEHCRRDLGLDSLRKRTVSEIAFFWGFNNLPHFSRIFRNRFGISPRQFRQQAFATLHAVALVEVRQAQTLTA